uniref:Secreted protein n=1 Tax=Ixodes ricinus TaxID=34613 RepID=A0A6B0UPX8_IXORI
MFSIIWVNCCVWSVSVCSSIRRSISVIFLRNRLLCFCFFQRFRRPLCASHRCKSFESAICSNLSTDTTTLAELTSSFRELTQSLKLLISFGAVLLRNSLNLSQSVALISLALVLTFFVGKVMLRM